MPRPLGRGYSLMSGPHLEARMRPNVRRCLACEEGDATRRRRGCPSISPGVQGLTLESEIEAKRRKSLQVQGKRPKPPQAVPEVPARFRVYSCGLKFTSSIVTKRRS